MLSKKQKLKSFFRGAGSVLELYPHTKPIDIGRDILNRSAEDSIAEDWYKVGNYLWGASNGEINNNIALTIKAKSVKEE